MDKKKQLVVDLVKNIGLTIILQAIIERLKETNTEDERYMNELIVNLERTLYQYQHRYEVNK